MAVTSPDNNKENESSLLIEIITNLRNVIETYYIINSGSNNLPSVTPMIPGRYHDEFIDAWDEIRPKINNVIEIIKKKDYNSSTNGLSGAQLRLKYEFCKDALDNVKDWYNKEKMIEKPKNISWYKKGFYYLNRFFQGSNIVVSSLSKSIPGAEQIKEFIEVVTYLSELGTDYLDYKYK